MNIILIRINNVFVLRRQGAVFHHFEKVHV